LRQRITEAEPGLRSAELVQVKDRQFAASISAPRSVTARCAVLAMRQSIDWNECYVPCEPVLLDDSGTHSTDDSRECVVCRAAVDLGEKDDRLFVVELQRAYRTVAQPVDAAYGRLDLRWPVVDAVRDQLVRRTLTIRPGCLRVIAWRVGSGVAYQLNLAPRLRGVRLRPAA
jgi:hypothetical protein